MQVSQLQVLLSNVNHHLIQNNVRALTLDDFYDIQLMKEFSLFPVSQYLAMGPTSQVYEIQALFVTVQFLYREKTMYVVAWL